MPTSYMDGPLLELVSTWTLTLSLTEIEQQLELRELIRKPDHRWVFQIRFQLQVWFEDFPTRAFRKIRNLQ